MCLRNLRLGPFRFKVDELATAPRKTLSNLMSRSLPPPDDRQALRGHFRHARLALTGFPRRFRQQRLLTALTRSDCWQQSRHIALYLPNDGEVDLTALRRLDRGKQLYLPCLRPDRSLRFIAWTPGTILRKNRYGIGEPPIVHGALRRAAELDLILMPLVGFDHAGNRLGMGGGFYDRTLATLKNRPGKPWLVGAAFELQRHPGLPHAPWDIPLDYMLTERGLLLPRPGTRSRS